MLRLALAIALGICLVPVIVAAAAVLGGVVAILLPVAALLAIWEFWPHPFAVLGAASGAFIALVLIASHIDDAIKKRRAEREYPLCQ